MPRKLLCLRCKSSMQYIRTQKIQLGQTGFILGDLPNLLAGAMEVEIYSCTECGKIEFFQSASSTHGDSTPGKKCPRCGKIHDFDYPKCPFCNYCYYENK